MADSLHKDANLPPPPLSPFYDSLTTNLPHPLMAFSGFTFRPSTPLSPNAQVVSSYLQDYARAFGLYKYIRFNESVSKVEFEPTTRRWIIHIMPPSSSSFADLRYDADLLLICNQNWINIKKLVHPIDLPSDFCANDKQTANKQRELENSFLI